MSLSKKLTCKGTLRHGVLSFCGPLPAYDPILPPLQNVNMYCIQFTYTHRGRGEGGGYLSRGRWNGKSEEAEGGRGAAFVERGSGKREVVGGRGIMVIIRQFAAIVSPGSPPHLRNWRNSHISCYKVTHLYMICLPGGGGGGFRARGRW